MPTSGPVYQPTTVSYEQQNEWSSQPRSYLAQTVNRVNNPRCVQWSLLALGIASVAIGCILFIEATIYTDSNKSAISIESTDSASSSIVLAVIGIILIVIGILLVVAYVRLVQRRKGWPCFNNKSQRLTRDLDNQTNNGQILTLNHPSTDLLVTSSQYNTVNEVPPTLSEEEETRKLMGSDIKDSRRLQIRSIVRRPDQAHAPRTDQSDLSPRSLYEARHPPTPLSSNLRDQSHSRPQASSLTRNLDVGQVSNGTTSPNLLDIEARDASTPLSSNLLDPLLSRHCEPSQTNLPKHPPSKNIPLTSRLLKALRAPLASMEDMTSSLESSAWSVTSRRDSVARSQLLSDDSVVRPTPPEDSVHTLSASRFSV